MSDTRLDTSFRLGKQGDDVYAALIEAHRGLSDEASARLNARLVLLLANHIGNAAVVIEAIAKAREGLVVSSPEDGELTAGSSDAQK